ncbi:MAG: caspase family protein [Candidatus Cryptobacteroides sp.]|nr:caspase family protein [Candidatus Cryptobacteroides sp.]
MKPKFYLIPLLMLLSAQSALMAQSVTTESISFKLEDVTTMFMPPDLRMDINFIDSNNDNILEANENGKLCLTINNRGGKANDVKIAVTPVGSSRGITVKQSTFTTQIDENGSSTIEIPMSASVDVPTGNTKFAIKVSEPMGYDINAFLELSTFAYQKARLKMNGVEITDSGKDLRAANGNPDNKLQNLDVVRAAVMIQNIGEGQAEGITYTVSSKDPNINFLTQSGVASSISGSLDELLVGQTGEISFRLSPNARYTHKGGYIPVYLTVKEKMGFGNIISEQIPIPFDEAAVKPEIVKVEGNREKLIASLGTKVYSEDVRVTTDARLKDIMVVPQGQALYPDAVAIVIGTEEYLDKNLPSAPYAERDAKVMTEYFKKAMGVGNVRTLTNEQVTNMELKRTFDSSRGKLASMVVPGKTDLFVYYSGHGVPMEGPDGRKDILLIPYDVDKEWIRDEGFSLNKLYADLGKLNAKSVTVILDACFSGGSRRSDAFSTKSIANQKLVIIDQEEMEQPWLDNTNFRVFTSSRGDQASLGYDKSCSGLFTYFIATGLQGDADKDGNGRVEMSELVNFVTEQVNKESDGAQTPQFYGDSNFVVEIIK